MERWEYKMYDVGGKEKLESIEKLIEKEERQLKRYQDRLARTESKLGFWEQGYACGKISVLEDLLDDLRDILK